MVLHPAVWPSARESTMSRVQSSFRKYRWSPPAILLGAVIVAAMMPAGCRRVTRELVPPEGARQLDSRSAYLKVHTRSGLVYVLSPWEADSSDAHVRGTGVLLGTSRDTASSGDFVIPIDSVALFETNVTRLSPAVAALAVVTAASVALTIVCIANPKACFGSCPTFYVPGNDRSVLAAEGFSASIAPSLEATDLDALYRARPAGRRFTLEMKNEALETHVVRSVDLLVAPKPDGGRVAATRPGELWCTGPWLPLAAATDEDGECTEELRALDDRERISEADSLYLGARETIDLAFGVLPSDGKRLGLIIASRQSLLTTYLLYQTLAYMGDLAGEWFALLERGGGSARAGGDSLGSALGIVDVEVKDANGRWIVAGQAGETGPLATNLNLVLLPEDYDPAQGIRLSVTRGHMRLDYVAITRVLERMEPIRLRPERALTAGVADDSALSRLLDPERVLVTMPGDAWSFDYTLPPDYERCELFLESRGYYFEWIRQEWLAEQDAVRTLQVLTDPDGTLRRLAPAYKAVEGEMEDLFWNSRYARP